MEENPQETKKPEGRPPLYSNPIDLQTKIEEYFTIGVKLKTIIVGPKTNRYEVTIPVPTITGLVLYLGFNSRSSFYAYEDKPDFMDTIKKARTRIEQEYEEQLQCGLGSGAIFALKNFGWKDEHTVKNEGLGETRIIIVRPSGERDQISSISRQVPVQPK